MSQQGHGAQGVGICGTRSTQQRQGIQKARPEDFLGEVMQEQRSRG